MSKSQVLQLGVAGPIERLGGKGLSLTRLSAAGFKVPGGIILTTKAYQNFVQINELGDRLLEAALPTVDRGVLVFENAAGRCAELIEKGTLTDDLVDQMHSLCDDEGEGVAFAVRSSATAEDLPKLSFAGQHDTFLNVKGLAAVLEAVRSCWASLWSARALAYRHSMGIDNADVAMAVVIQRLVSAEVSGILFTANPASGTREELVVNSSYGLGEAVVSGIVDPDHYVINHESLEVKTSKIGKKATRTVSDGFQGTREEVVSEEIAKRGSLTRSNLTDLSNMALAIERQFDGIPQDIEWLYADGEFWVLQSRPITNLPPEPLLNVRWDPPEPGAYLQRSQWVEHVPEPVSTLFEDLHMKRSLQEAWGHNLARRGNHDFEDTQPPACFCLTTTVNGFAYRQVGEPPRTGRLESTTARRARPRWLSSFLAKLRMHLIFVAKWRYIALPRYLREIRSWQKLNPSTASIEQLWSGIRALSRADAQYWYTDGVWNAFALSRGFEFSLHKFLEDYGENQFTSGHFLSGLTSAASDGYAKLAVVAGLIRKNKALFDAVVRQSPHRLLDVLADHPDGEPARQALFEYFEGFGHQVFTLDFVEPSEFENPVNTLRSLYLLVLRDDYDPLATRQRLKFSRRQTIKVASKQFRGKSKLQFWWKLWLARRYYPNREQAMFELGKAWTVLRPLAKELGRRLVRVGTLIDPDEIFFLTTEELGRAVRSVVALGRLPETHHQAHYPDGPGLPMYADLAAKRLELRERRKRLRPPSLIPGPPPWSPLTTDTANDGTGCHLKGSAVSPGRATGKACVIHSAQEFDKMRPGMILVCPTTTPAWSQLFPHAMALVTDIGGILAHGSIVAREYGIPAVLGLIDATDRISDGQTITVDGDRGIVEL